LFDKDANNEIDCLMSMIATTKYEAGDSLRIRNDILPECDMCPEDDDELNFEEKVCKLIE
jgi:hypothetical protein